MNFRHKVVEQNGQKQCPVCGIQFQSIGGFVLVDNDTGKELCELCKIEKTVAGLLPYQIKMENDRSVNKEALWVILSILKFESATFEDFEKRIKEDYFDGFQARIYKMIARQNGKQYISKLEPNDFEQWRNYVEEYLLADESFLNEGLVTTEKKYFDRKAFYSGEFKPNEEIERWVYEPGQIVKCIDVEGIDDSDLFVIESREKDEEDNQYYAVKRISDGEVWENVACSLIEQE